MSDVQRYETCAIGLNNIALKNAIQKADTGPLVHYSDYAALEAECQRYREALEKIRTHTTACMGHEGRNMDDCDTMVKIAKQALEDQDADK